VQLALRLEVVRVLDEAVQDVHAEAFFEHDFFEVETLMFNHFLQLSYLWRRTA
jgi:hypothetical protein